MDAHLFIDTHAHLYDEAFDTDREATIERAQLAGVTRFILPGIDASTQPALENLADRYPDCCFACVGLHPTSINNQWEEELALVQQRLHKRSYVAIGEIGLDGYWSREFIREQQEAFYRQLVWASERNLPVIIHLREATDFLFEVLDRFRNEKKVLPQGVFHAFSGSTETYERICQYGDFYFGIGGVSTYKKAGIAETLTHIPLTRILLETDAPYLTPVPYRGKRNEPAYIPFIAQRIAELKNCSLQEVSETTTQNALNLFNLPR